MSATTLLQALASGLLVGSFYALVAVGFSLVLGVTRALNLAHGEIVVLGGYAAYGLWRALDLHPLLLLPLSAAATLPLALVWHWALARLRPPVELQSCVLTFGLSLALQSAMTTLGGGDYRLIASAALAAPVRLGPIALSEARVAAALAALGVVAALGLALTGARWGRALRATSIDREAAALLGIDVERSTLVALALAMALAGGAGTLFATIHYLYPTAGVDLTLLAIVLSLWAGGGRLRSLLLAGLALGVAEALTIVLTGPGWREPAVAALLLASLLVRGGSLAAARGH